MIVLKTTLEQMAVLFLFVAIGFFLRRKKLLPADAHTVLSKLENYVLLPALTVNTLMTQCTVQNLKEKLVYVAYAAVILGITCVIAYFVAKKCSKDGYEQRMYRYSLVITNQGFFGNALVLGMFGEEALFTFIMFAIPHSIFCNSIGVSWLIPDNVGGKKKSFWKSLANPTCIAVVIGIILGVSGLPLPRFLTMAISGAAACMSPVAMVFTGIVVAGFELRTLLKNPKVHLTAILRLVVIPLLFVVPMTLLGAPSDVIMMALCYLALPLGLYTILVPAAHGADTKLGASLTIVSLMYAIVTIPVLFAIFL